MIDLLKYRYVYFLISALILLPGLVFIGLGGLKPGIDFTGGTELTVLMPRNAHATVGAVESIVRSVSYKGQAGYLDENQVQQVQVQGAANRQGFLIRTRDIVRPSSVGLAAGLSRGGCSFEPAFGGAVPRARA